MVWHWLVFWCSFKTFRLVLKPSSVGKNNVNTRDSKTARWARAEENSAWSFLKNVARDLCACQRLVNFWDGDVIISRLWIPYRKPGFQEESFMKISLVSNNSGTSKIHFVVVLVDVAGTLAILESWSNIATALLCSVIRVFSGRSVWP